MVGTFGTEGKTRRLQRLTREEKAARKVLDNLKRLESTAYATYLDSVARREEVERECHTLVEEWHRTFRSPAKSRWVTITPFRAKITR